MPANFDDSMLDARTASRRARAATARTRPWWRRRGRAGAEADQLLLERIGTPLPRSRRVLVMSSKGGVGKTTTTLLLGHALAAHRTDRVVAIDLDVACGSLAHRAGSDPRDGAVDDAAELLRTGGQVRGYAALRAFTVATPSGLEVLPAPAAAYGRPVHSSEYLRLLGRLQRSYSVMLLDTATGVLDELASGVRAAADQMVLVIRPSIDEARAGSVTLDILADEGAGDLVSAAVVVANGFRGSAGVDTAAVLEPFRRRCRAVVEVPFDPALDHGGAIVRDELLSETRAAYLALAAEVADGFSLTGHRQRPPPAEHGSSG